MSTKSRPAPAKKAPAKTATASVAKAAVSVGMSALGLGGAKKTGGKRKHKKSTLWYVRAYQKEKAKRKYEKLKYGFGR